MPSGTAFPRPGDGLELEFGALPSPLAAYARAVLAARKPVRAPAPPAIRATVRGVRIDPAHLARYRAACGLPPGELAPPAYPQALAFPLHLAVYTHPAFPLRLLGAVHLRNLFTQRRALASGETVAVHVALAGWRDAPRGIEHELATEVRDGAGALVWTGVSTVLSPDRSAARPPPRPPEPPRTFERSAPIAVPADAGRRYARATGDYNPIHLGALGARPFGFRRPIAHGMWTLARALATLEPAAAALRVEVAFRKPLFLPADVSLHWTPGAETAFELRSAAGDVAHLQGSLGAPAP
ncbi:MAG TPA: MaoC/PaaZ C-terminal domain-containing protein [Anaeromyxobacteraceae bacterium]|nr:MaoC/PaaZ C-terminal domain-containing protein [Anaeromyxobacteraceae bacterium]